MTGDVWEGRQVRFYVRRGLLAAGGLFTLALILSLGVVIQVTWSAWSSRPTPPDAATFTAPQATAAILGAFECIRTGCSTSPAAVTWLQTHTPTDGFTYTPLGEGPGVDTPYGRRATLADLSPTQWQTVATAVTRGGRVGVVDPTTVTQTTPDQTQFRVPGGTLTGIMTFTSGRKVVSVVYQE